MGSPMQRSAWRDVVPRWVGWYFAILMWEMLTIPGVSHSNSWQGVWLSLIVLPLSAVHLCRCGARPGTLFVYGCAGAFLFLPRFLMMDRFSLWLQYQAPSDSVLVFCWICFALGMGAACSFSATAMLTSASPEAPPAPPQAHQP